MARCIFCLEEKNPLTDEHIIPAALGSNVVLRKAVCEDCQKHCNRSFEQRFLKGSNFISLLRAHLGIRGRRNEPVYGFDQHGKPLTVEVQPGFPPIRIGLKVNGLERPMQVILADESRTPLNYYFLPNEIQRPILPGYFDTIVDHVPTEAKFVSFWADGDVIAANPWRELLEAFVVWANQKSLLPSASSIAAGMARVPFALDWNVDYRNRGLAKICFLYALAQLSEGERLHEAFQPIRNYILYGKFDVDFWVHGPVLQWDGPQPSAGLGDFKFTYLLATIVSEQGIFGLVRLHNMGLFCVKLSLPMSDSQVRDTLTTYLLERNQGEKYAFLPHEHSVDQARLLAEAARNSRYFN